MSSLIPFATYLTRPVKRQIHVSSNIRFHRLPVEVYNEIATFLDVQDLSSLSKTSTNLRYAFNARKWRKCIVHSDHAYDPEWRSRRLSHQAIPLRVVLKPSKYQWFWNENVRILVINVPDFWQRYALQHLAPDFLVHAFPQLVNIRFTVYASKTDEHLGKALVGPEGTLPFYFVNGYSKLRVATRTVCYCAYPRHITRFDMLTSIKFELDYSSAAFLENVQCGLFPQLRAVRVWCFIWQQRETRDFYLHDAFATFKEPFPSSVKALEVIFTVNETVLFDNMQDFMPLRVFENIDGGPAVMPSVTSVSCSTSLSFDSIFHSVTFPNLSRLEMNNFLRTASLPYPLLEWSFESLRFLEVSVRFNVFDEMLDFCDQLASLSGLRFLALKFPRAGTFGDLVFGVAECFRELDGDQLDWERMEKAGLKRLDEELAIVRRNPACRAHGAMIKLVKKNKLEFVRHVISAVVDPEKRYSLGPLCLAGTDLDQDSMHTSYGFLDLKAVESTMQIIEECLNLEYLSIDMCAYRRVAYSPAFYRICTEHPTIKQIMMSFGTRYFRNMMCCVRYEDLFEPRGRRMLDGLVREFNLPRGLYMNASNGNLVQCIVDVKERRQFAHTRRCLSDTEPLFENCPADPDFEGWI